MKIWLSKCFIWLLLYSMAEETQFSQTPSSGETFQLPQTPRSEEQETPRCLSEHVSRCKTIALQSPGKVAMDVLAIVNTTQCAATMSWGIPHLRHMRTANVMVGITPVVVRLANRNKKPKIGGLQRGQLTVQLMSFPFEHIDALNSVLRGILDAMSLGGTTYELKCSMEISGVSHASIENTPIHVQALIEQFKKSSAFAAARIETPSNGMTPYFTARMPTGTTVQVYPKLLRGRQSEPEGDEMELVALLHEAQQICETFANSGAVVQPPLGPVVQPPLGPVVQPLGPVFQLPLRPVVQPLGPVVQPPLGPVVQPLGSVVQPLGPVFQLPLRPIPCRAPFLSPIGSAFVHTGGAALVHTGGAALVHAGGAAKRFRSKLYSAPDSDSNSSSESECFDTPRAAGVLGMLGKES